MLSAIDVGALCGGFAWVFVALIFLFADKSYETCLYILRAISSEDHRREVDEVDQAHSRAFREYKDAAQRLVQEYRLAVKMWKKRLGDAIAGKIKLEREVNRLKAENEAHVKQISKITEEFLGSRKQRESLIAELTKERDELKSKATRFESALKSANDTNRILLGLKSNSHAEKTAIANEVPARECKSLRGLEVLLSQTPLFSGIKF